MDESIEAEVTVTNTGERTGTEAVLWFISDEVGKISRPVKELIYFERVELKPGESKVIKLTLEPTENLTYPDFNGKPILEDGYFKIHAGDKTKRFYLDSTETN
jgi:beta-glucosidase